jgi:hypothetical protein
MRLASSIPSAPMRSSCVKNSVGDSPTMSRNSLTRCACRATMARSSRPARRSSIVSRAAAAAASVRRAAGRKTRPASVSSGLDHVKAIAGAAEPLLLGGGDEGLELSQLHPPIISEAQHIVADRDNHRSSYGELQQPLEVVDAEIGGSLVRKMPALLTIVS